MYPDDPFTRAVPDVYEPKTDAAAQPRTDSSTTRSRAVTRKTIKNKERSERDVLITSEVADIVRDYRETNRKDVTDDHDREPLLTSKSGRIVETTIPVRLHDDPSLLLQRWELPI